MLFFREKGCSKQPFFFFYQKELILFSFESENCPAEIQNQVNGIIFSLQEFLGPLLLSVCLTGSLAKGNFFKENSNINLLFVVNKNLNPFKRLFIARKMMMWEKAPAPVHIYAFSTEKSVLHKEKTLQFVFSEKEKDEYRFCLNNKETNSDLICQDIIRDELDMILYATKKKSVTLYGENINTFIDEIPFETALQSFKKTLKDFVWHPENKKETANHILRLCQLWCFAVTKEDLSKKEAGEWVIRRIAKKRAVFIQKALRFYLNIEKIRVFKLPALLDFEKHIFEKVDA